MPIMLCCVVCASGHTCNNVTKLLANIAQSSHQFWIPQSLEEVSHASLQHDVDGLRLVGDGVLEGRHCGTTNVRSRVGEVLLGGEST